MHKLLVFEALIAFIYMLQEFNCSESDADNFEYTYETDKVELNNIYLMKNELKYNEISFAINLCFLLHFLRYKLRRM